VTVAENDEALPQEDGAPLAPEDIELDIGPGFVPAQPASPTEPREGFGLDIGSLPETAKLSIYGLAMLILAAAFSAWGMAPWKKRGHERLVI
jgi:hypothetical protein